jgi:hypothetical protein
MITNSIDAWNFIRAELPELTIREALWVWTNCAMESNFSLGWAKHDVTPNPNNWGAVIAPAPKPGTTPDPTKVFWFTKDTMWNPSAGGNVPAPTFFRRYATPAEGMKHAASLLLTKAVAPAVRNGNWFSACELLRRKIYWTGREPYWKAVATRLSGLNTHSAIGLSRQLPGLTQADAIYQAKSLGGLALAYRVAGAYQISACFSTFATWTQVAAKMAELDPEYQRTPRSATTRKLTPIMYYSEVDIARRVFSPWY